MDESILNNVKKVLGLAPEYQPFDEDVIMHINAAFSILNQLGVGPLDGFVIEGDSRAWGDYGYYIPDNQLMLVKTYIYLKVKVLFDPPATSFHLSAAQDQIKEYEWRLNCFREVDLVQLPLPKELNIYASASVDSNLVVSWDSAYPKIEVVKIYHRIVGSPSWIIQDVPITDPYSSEIVIPVVPGLDYEIYVQSTAEGFEPRDSDHTFITALTPSGPTPLDPPLNAAVTPISGSMVITWEDTPNVMFVLVYSKVVGDTDFDVNAWGIDQHVVVQDSDVGVDYEYYLQSTADGYESADSEHFVVTGI